MLGGGDGSLKLLAICVSTRFSVRPCLKKIRWREMETDTNIDLCTDIHLSIYPCVYAKTSPPQRQQVYQPSSSPPHPSTIVLETIEVKRACQHLLETMEKISPLERQLAWCGCDPTCPCPLHTKDPHELMYQSWLSLFSLL